MKNRKKNATADVKVVLTGGVTSKKTSMIGHDVDAGDGDGRHADSVGKRLREWVHGGGSIDLIDKRSGLSLLMSASASNTVPAMKALLEMRANVNAVSSSPQAGEACMAEEETRTRLSSTEEIAGRIPPARFRPGSSPSMN